eukprot:TRINITY_DN2593_c0_g1_i1.p1 TRINITY_DN2593_c0_g1~~TRINITY_DN2593_c0_g1_i1.p1  ORF type:complete len:312 (-),score=149.84 TRINITY_DN2593_c0_g1_i1:147-1082(-)
MSWAIQTAHGLPPTPLCKHTATLVANQIFIIGGAYSTYAENEEVVDIFNDMVVMDIETRFFHKPIQTGKIPVPHKAHTATAVGDKVFVIAGGDGPNYYDHVYMLDTKTMNWAMPQVSGQIPSARRAHTATAVGNKIYVFGGGDGASALNDCYIFDTETMHWSVLPTTGKPEPRGYHTASLVGNKIVVIGGSNTQSCFRDIWVLDIDKKTWAQKKIPDMQARYAHTAQVIGSWIFVYGGCNELDFVKETICIDTDTWQIVNINFLGDPPVARGYHTSILSDLRVFVIGGSSANEYFNDVHTLELATLSFLAK